LNIYEGDHYTFDGVTIILDPDYFGQLFVYVSVSEAYSEVYDLKIEIVEVLGIEDIRNEIEINPNPTDGIINYSLGSNNENVSAIRLLNILGQVVLHDIVVPLDHNNTIDIRKVKQGIYSLQLKIMDPWIDFKISKK